MAIDEINGGPYGRRSAGSATGTNHQIGMRNDGENGVGYRRGCIDDRQANAAAFEMLKRALQIECADLGEGRRFFDARVPQTNAPCGSVSIRATAQPPTSCFDRQMAGERRFAGTSLWEAIATTNMKEPSIPDADHLLKDGAFRSGKGRAKIEVIVVILIRFTIARGLGR